MKVFKKGDTGYEAARLNRVFNKKKPDRYPEAVLFPENAQDVVEAVRYANANQYKIAMAFRWSQLGCLERAGQRYLARLAAPQPHCPG